MTGFSFCGFDLGSKWVGSKLGWSSHRIGFGSVTGHLGKIIGVPKKIKFLENCTYVTKYANIILIWYYKIFILYQLIINFVDLKKRL